MRMRGLKVMITVYPNLRLRLQLMRMRGLKEQVPEYNEDTLQLQLMRMRGLKAVAVAQLPGRGGCNSCVCLSCDHEKRRLFIGKRLKHSK